MVRAKKQIKEYSLIPIKARNHKAGVGAPIITIKHVMSDTGTVNYALIGLTLKGVGFIQKNRGENSWNGCIWVPNQTVAIILTLFTF